jgi:hypothetical protein
MSTITYDTTHTPRTAAPAAAKTPAQKTWLDRVVERMVAARQKQAFEAVRRYSIVLPNELERGTWKVTERSEASLPFNR